MAGGHTVIGTAAVKIRPDTDGFEKELRRKLAGGKDPTIKIKADFKELDKQMREKTKDIQDKFEKIKPKFGKIDSSEIEDELSSKQYEVNVKVKLDDTYLSKHFSNSFAEGFDRARVRIEAMPIKFDMVNVNKSFDTLKSTVHKVGFNVDSSQLDLVIMKLALLRALMRDINDTTIQVRGELKKFGDISRNTFSKGKELQRYGHGMDWVRVNTEKAANSMGDMSHFAPKAMKAITSGNKSVGLMGRLFGNLARGAQNVVRRLTPSSQAIESFGVGLASVIYRSGLFTKKINAMGPALLGFGKKLLSFGKKNALGFLAITMAQVGMKGQDMAKGLGKSAKSLSGFTMLSKLTKEMSHFSQNVGEMPEKVGPWVLSLELLRSSLIALSGNILSLGYDIARIVPIIGLLPGALAVFGAGAIITKRAMQDLGKEMAGPIKGFQQLGVAVSKNFWDVARGPLNQVANALLPEISAGSKIAATALGGMASSLALAVQAATKGRMNVIFDSLSKSAEAASRHVNKIVMGFTDMAMVGAKMMPVLIERFGVWADDMGEWMTKISGNGSLERWINGAIDQFSALASVVKSAGMIFGSFARAAQEAGSVTLEGLAESLRKMRDTVNSPEFKEGLVTTFTAANKAMKAFATEAGPAVRDLFAKFPALFSVIGPAVGEASGKMIGFIADFLASKPIMDGYQDLVLGIKDAVAKLGPVFESSKEPLGRFMTLLGELTSNKAESFANIIEGINDTIVTMQPFLEKLSLKLSDTGVAISELVKEGGDWIALNFGDELETTDASAKKLHENMKLLGDETSETEPKTTGLTKALDNMKIAFDISAPAATLMKESLGELNQKFKDSGAADNFSASMDALGKVFGWVGGAITASVFAIVWVLAYLGTKLLESIEWFNKWFSLPGSSGGEESQAAWGRVFDRMSEGIQKGIDKIKEKWNQFKTWMSDALTGNKTAVEDSTNDTNNTYKTRSGEIVQMGEHQAAGLAVSNSSIVSSAKAMGAGVSSAWTSMGSKISSINNSVNAKVNAWGTSVKNSVVRNFNSAKQSATTAWEGMKNAISTKMGEMSNKVASKLGEIKGKFSAFKSSAPGLLRSAGVAIMNGLIGGITSMIGKLAGKLNSITRMIPREKGPIGKDRSLLRPAGEAIMGGLIGAIEGEIPALQNTLHQITDLIEGTKFDVQGSVSSDSSSLSGLRSGALRGTLSSMGQVGDSRQVVVNYNSYTNEEAPINRLKYDMAELIADNNAWRG